MNMTDRSCRYQPPPPHRRKTPSFSSSLLDSILRSIDETTDLQQQPQQHHLHDHDLLYFASEPKRISTKIHLINEQEQIMPSLRRAIMINQWMDTHNNSHNNNRNGCVFRKQQQVSSDLSSTTFTTSSSSETETPSTYRSLPNSFTISREADDTQKAMRSNKREGKFIKSTKLRAMKIYGDLKKPISPGSRISAFIYSLFASSSSKKAKIEDSMQNFRSRSINNNKQLADTVPMSFSRSCMSKKQHATSHVKRSVRFYPEKDTVILDRKSIHERDADSTPKYERRWLAEKNYNNCMGNVEDDDEDEDEDEDDLFELEIVAGGVGRQELPVFETTDLRKIRI